MSFYINLALSVGCSGHLVPLAYKGVNTNYDEALPLGKFPTCAWSTDAYINWLTQNSANIKIANNAKLIVANSNKALFTKEHNYIGGSNINIKKNEEIISISKNMEKIEINENEIPNWVKEELSKNKIRKIFRRR